MLESLQARKINAMMWQAVPNIDNSLCKKRIDLLMST